MRLYGRGEGEVMNQQEWERIMLEAGWVPRRDLFGSIVEWSLRRGQRVVKISRLAAEPYRQLGQTPAPF